MSSISRHLEEWRASGVSDEITLANVTTLSGEWALEVVTGDAIAKSQKVTSFIGVEARRILDRYAHLEDGGWWATGLDPLNNWQRMEWGQFKPDSPRLDQEGKLIKYESPLRVEARAMFLSGAVDWAQVHADPTVPVYICEGAKKAGLLLTLGYAAIAIPGVWMGRRSKDRQGNPISHHLIPELEAFGQPGREFVFVFDEDPKPKTRRDVAAARWSTCQLLQDKGCEVVTCQWATAQGKGIDDVWATHGTEAVRAILDNPVEISRPLAAGEPDPIEYEAVLQQQAAAAAREAQRRQNGKITFERDESREAEREARDRLRHIDLGPQVSREEWLAKKVQASGDRYKDETERIQAELNNLRVVPTITATGRYIQPGMLALPERSGIVLINASMGTGKTATAIKGLVNDHRRLYSDAFRMLGVPRNLLGYQSGFELGLPHHKLLKSILNEITLCLESLLKLDPALLPALPPLIILDEASQTFKQILYGETCKDTQVAILNRLRQIFQWVKQQGGWIVLSEDGLTNCEIDFVQDLSGLEVVESLKFTKELEQARDYLVLPSPSLTWSEIEGRLFGGENIIACTDSAKWARETERWAINHCGLSPESVKVIDSRSSEEPWVKQFATNPDGFIAQDKPRLLIYTPSVNSGVSIADPTEHFDAMAFHLVHLEPREAKQLPDRLRTDVPRFGYVKERGATTDDQFSGCRPDVLIRDLHRNVEGVQRVTRFAEYALEKQPTDRDGNQIDLISTLDQVRNSQQDPTSEYGFWLKHWARYRAREAYSKLSLRDNLIDIWRQQGHEVELLEADAIKPLIEQRKEIREQLDTEQADRFALADASQLSLEDARSILNTLGSTQDDQLKAWKRLTIDKLPGCNLDDPAFVLKSLITDNGRFLRTTERLWLAINPDAAKMIDRWAWMGAFTRATAKDEIVWLPRLSVRAGQAKLINESPLHPFIKGEITQWDNNTAEAIAVHEWALLHGRQLKRYMRINVSEDHSPVKSVNKLLRHIGLDVTQIGWKGSRGNRQRQYAIENLQDADRDAILQALTDRFLSRCEEKQESPPPSVIATRADINPPTSCDHTPGKDDSEDLEFIRKMWADAAGNPSMLNEIRQMIPLAQLRRAISCPLAPPVCRITA